MTRGRGTGAGANAKLVHDTLSYASKNGLTLRELQERTGLSEHAVNFAVRAGRRDGSIARVETPAVGKRIRVGFLLAKTPANDLPAWVNPIRARALGLIRA